ncbi:MAG TPA: galactokinase [Gaiella sp.]|nr:galactokinase [Gaiella sp.]
MTTAYRAPGRVNLIGDHTDYNEGFVLPMAIDLACTATVERRGGDQVRVRSHDVAGDVEVAADGRDDPLDVSPGWGRYVAGVVRVLADRGRASVGIEATVSSTIPVGSGLSSSAALEVSLALALLAAAEMDLPPLELAQACRDAEQLATGVPCGIMDQLASIAGRRGCALLIDCRSLAVEPVELPKELAVVVVHSGVARSLDETAYASRRAECEAAAARHGVTALRDVRPEQVADEPRARHVVSENARVLEAAEALRRGDLAELGALLSASHASLRDDFEVSTPELDALATALEESGAFGARLTGAGFGGCVVAVAPRDAAVAVAERAIASYRAEGGCEARAWHVHAVDGAGRVG